MGGRDYWERPRSSKLLLVSPEHGHLCGGGEGREEEEEDDEEGEEEKEEEMVAAMLQGKEREGCDPEYDGGMGNGREAAAIGGGSGVYKSRGYF